MVLLLLAVLLTLGAFSPTLPGELSSLLELLQSAIALLPSRTLRISVSIARIETVALDGKELRKCWWLQA